MADPPSASEHRAMAWASLGGAAVAIGATVGVGLAVWGATAHLWADGYFLAGFAATCLLTALGVYALIAEFLGGVGPVRFPLPPTRQEREAKPGRHETSPDAWRAASEYALRVPAVPVRDDTDDLIYGAYRRAMRDRVGRLRRSGGEETAPEERDVS